MGVLAFMTSKNDTQAARSRRAAEAASIVRRLDENPNDTNALADKLAFVSRGQAEKRTYALAERAIAAATKGINAKDRRRTYSFAVLGALLLSLFALREPIWIGLQADHRSQLTVATTALKSGDVLVLDASSAVEDDTGGALRTVTLLRGGGFFDVTTDGRGFVVQAGDVSVEVLGTAFEVMHLEDGLRVTVSEGHVSVRSDARVENLSAGEQLFVRGDDIEKRGINETEVARWRNRELSLNGLTLAQAARFLDRRVPGRVLVLGHTLSNTNLRGTLDLSDPRNAIEVLAATGNARVVRTSRFLTVLYAE